MTCELDGKQETLVNSPSQHSIFMEAKPWLKTFVLKQSPGRIGHLDLLSALRRLEHCVIPLIGSAYCVFIHRSGLVARARSRLSGWWVDVEECAA